MISEVESEPPPEFRFTYQRRARGTWNIANDSRSCRSARMLMRKKLF